MRRRFVIWLVCLLASALPLQSMAAVARMACSPPASVGSLGSLGSIGTVDPHAMHRAASVSVPYTAHGAATAAAHPETSRHHDAGCIACAACCVATAPPSPSLMPASLPAPSVLAAEPVLPELDARTSRLERPPRPAIA